MATREDFIKKYATADVDGRMEIILKNYSRFPCFWLSSACCTTTNGKWFNETGKTIGNLLWYRVK